MDYSLSTNDIYEKIGRNNVDIITYQELSKINDIDQLFNNVRNVVILFETRDNYGHWCLIFKTNWNSIEFFDSYGFKPDAELKFIDSYFRLKNNMEYPHLTQLLLDSKYNIEYNNHRLQSKIGNINTCGRWVVCRIILSDLNSDEFYNIFKKFKKKDEIVLKLTNDT